MKILAILLAFTFTAECFSAPDQNTEVPEFVYRVDKRHYTYVFKNGFKSWSYEQDNENLNIADHVSGRSCTTLSNNRNSAFISTSASRQLVERLAKNIISKSKDGEYITIYTIHPDRNTYETYRSLIWLEEHGSVPVSPMEFSMSLSQNEWVALHSIDPSSIESATVYFRERDRIRIEEHHNQYYIYSLDSVANPSPFTGFTPQAERSNNWRVWIQNNLQPIVSQCFSSTRINSTDVYIVNNSHQTDYSAILNIIGAF